MPPPLVRADRDGFWPHFPFEAVQFEPKPLTTGGPPIMVGGESAAALDRAARIGDGSLGMRHTPESARAVVHRVRRLRASYQRNGSFEIVVVGDARHPTDLEAWADAGVDYVVVQPWTSSRHAVEAMERLAHEFGLEGRRL